MKVVLTKTVEFEFNPELEITRLKACFKGRRLKRQMEILEHFLSGDHDKMEACYIALPYDATNECAEQEYVGMWFAILFCGYNPYAGKEILKLCSDETIVEIV